MEGGDKGLQKEEEERSLAEQAETRERKKGDDPGGSMD